MTGWAVDAVLASALLIAAVLLLRAPVRRVFGPTVAYALWALPALRLALPPMPEEWRDTAVTPISRAGELVVHLVAVPAVAEQPATASVAPLLWLAGCAAFLLWHLARYVAFRARILRDHDSVARIGRVRVVLSTAAPGPLAFGVLRPHVAMPADLDRLYDADERALALAHELGHHARGDLIANWVALVVLAVHWWNPLAWIAHRAFRADQELANDARILRERGPDVAHAYARAILKAAGGRGHAVACHLHPVSDLKGRIRMLKAEPISPRRLVTGIAGVAFLATTTLALTASGTRAAAVVKERVGDTIGVDLDAAELDLTALDLPVQPSPPLPPAAPVQAAPILPSTSPTPEIAPVPPIPPAPPVSGVDGETNVTVVRTKDGRVTRRVFRMRDGPTVDLSSIPEIENRHCGDGDRPVIRNERRGGKRVTIICADRIERAAQSLGGSAATMSADTAERWARDAQRGAVTVEDGKQVERDALRGALEGLLGARSSIVGNPHLTNEQRRRAIAGLEQGLREIQSDLDRVR